MEYLHKATDQSEKTKEEIPVLSTDYMMPVYHIPSVAEDSTRPICIASHTYGIQLSVRVNLRPGISMEQLAQALNGVCAVYQISGSSDCLLVSKTGKDFSELLRMLMPRHPHGNERMMALVMDTETTLSRKVQGIDEPRHNLVLSRSELLKDTIYNLRKTLSVYQNLLEKTHRHMRQLSALYEQVTAIENICGECHNKSLQAIMNEWIPAFTDCLNECISIMEEEVVNDINAPKSSIWRYTEDALDRFIDQVGSFLSDLSRSDCFFMESERYNHPSVSSATALLIAYNRWQNNFSKAVTSEAKTVNATYSFLVRSGGCDSTNTNNLFWFLSPKVICAGNPPQNIIQENLPLITHMSEMSLFDCGGTVFRMAHECMHYCGDRERIARAEYLIQFISWYYGRILAEALFNKDALLSRTILQLKQDFLLDDAQLLTELENCWHTRWKELAKKIAEEISAQLMQTLRAECGSWDETHYISYHLRNWMMNKLSLLFSSYTFTKGEESLRVGSVTQWHFNQLATTMYYSQLETTILFYDDCDKTIQKYDKMYKFFALERRRLTSLKRKANSNQKETVLNDKVLEQWIPLVLSQLLMDEAYNAGDNYQVVKMRRSSLGEFLEDVVFDCFSESFADIEACMRLDASISDYLLGFVFENWDLNTALAKIPPFIYRIPAVLRTCFSGMLNDDKLSLNKEARNQLNTSIEHLRSHGLPQYRINGADLADRVDVLLKEYSKYEWEATSLEDYLKLCKENYRENEQEKMRAYKEAFHQIRLLDMDSDSDRVTQMFTSLSMIKGG